MLLTNLGAVTVIFFSRNQGVPSFNSPFLYLKPFSLGIPSAFLPLSWGLLFVSLSWFREHPFPCNFGYFKISRSAGYNKGIYSETISLASMQKMRHLPGSELCKTLCHSWLNERAYKRLSLGGFFQETKPFRCQSDGYSKTYKVRDG